MMQGGSHLDTSDDETGNTISKIIKRTQKLTKTPTQKGYLAFSHQEWKSITPDTKTFVQNTIIL